VSHVYSIKLPTIKFNLSCYASGKWAEHFFLAEQHFPKDIGFSPVPYFLNCQSLELGLKAFLLLRGTTKEDLKRKPFGHNLESLLAKAKSLNFGQFVTVDSQDEVLVAKVNKFYDVPGGKSLQYIDVGWAAHGFEGLPDLGDLEKFVQKVVTNAGLKKMYLEA
jgi:hypothetical protein